MELISTIVLLGILSGAIITGTFVVVIILKGLIKNNQSNL